MSRRNHFSFSSLLRKYLSAEEKSFPKEIVPKNILVVRQHNQFGDLLASVSLFRAIKETYPASYLTVIASRENYYAVTNNEFIDRLFIFDKTKFWNPVYLLSLFRHLKGSYDLAIVPSTVAISKTSCLLAGISDADYKIGPSSLEGKRNEYDFVFNMKIPLSWSRYPDAHVSDFILDIVRPAGILTRNLKSSISFGENEKLAAEKFIAGMNCNGRQFLVGLHIGAGKPPNRWSLLKYIRVIELLDQNYEVGFYITGSRADNEVISFMKSNLKTRVYYFIDRSIPELACLIASSDLFITNDTGVMHVAGATAVPQISIFGPTNPFNWAPAGTNKYFLKKSDLIDDVTVDDVFSLSVRILGSSREKK